ncbi:MAG: hypothetical protein COV70_02180 [Parcubacteria group bacterium CG11_big_fil_rev_8_21_14_0_20_39_22]|nr:MAG: hypothetical protein COV70_02180 [Parcubacteria group bacterium CG11_big_fil_rev_8_21_14_0_20_39_22]
MFEQKNVRNSVVVVLVILALFLAAQTLLSLRQFSYVDNAYQKNTISVSGEGEVFAVPDVGTFTFSVTVEADTANEAQATAAERTDSIMSFLTDQGIEEKDIKTVGYNVYPRYEYYERALSYPTPEGQRQLVGFEASQSIQVKVRELENVGTLLSGIGERGATNISGLSFTVDDETDIIAEARAKAIADAKEKAKALAQDLGVRLGEIVSFSEGGNYPVMYAQQEAYGMGGDAAVKNFAVPAGENKFVSNVNIVYEIR